MQILDAPVPQGGGPAGGRFRHLDLHVPEQAIKVPKISSSARRSRRRWVSLGADGGTVGGSSEIRVVCLSVPAADR